MLNKVQRHTEMGNQQYRNYIQPANQDVFEIFNDRIKDSDPVWYEKKILDFGCNIGHLLTTSAGKIKPQNYVGVDIYQPALAIASKKYPDAEWVHYNGYNSTFNPAGNKDLSFVTEKKFDYIIVYGVFTHCDIVEIKKQINSLRKFVTSGGSIIFSVWEDLHLPGYLNFLKNCFEINLGGNPGFSTRFEKSFYLVNREYSIVDTENSGLTDCLWLETFYNRLYLKTTIPSIEFMPGIYSHHSIFRLQIP